MPTISIYPNERYCCNCARFEFYDLPSRIRNNAFKLEHNIGYCWKLRQQVKATRRQCKDCERR